MDKSLRNAKYVAVAEVMEIGMPGHEEMVIVFDAIARSDLSTLREPSRYKKQENGLGEMFAPLLFLTKDSSLFYLAETSEWLSLTLRSSSNRLDGEFEVRTLSVGEDVDDEGLRLWCKLDEMAPSRAELATLRRLAEVEDLRPGDDLDGGIDLASPAALAVYDVGQGSFSALVDEHEHPLMFFDLGWPLVPLNSKSLPTIPNFDPFVFDRKDDPAPVVLSHFDWDHWGYAWLNGRAVWDSGSGAWKTAVTYRHAALNRPWLVRRPRFKRHALGPSHLHLIQVLRSTRLSDGTRALKIYPSRNWTITYGPATIIRCSMSWSGSANSSLLRNNEALAGYFSRGEYRVLYCGDAEFRSVPSKYQVSLTGVVAPHHGGQIDLKHIPAPASRGAVMAVSTYSGCYSNVPSPDVEKHAVTLGWSWAKTETRIKCGRGGCMRGNLYLPLSPNYIRCKCGVVQTNCLCLT